MTTRWTSVAEQVPDWVIEFVHPTIPRAMFVWSWMSRTFGGLMCVAGEQVGNGGVTPAIVMENGDGPATPNVFVAVTLKLVVPETDGVPVRIPVIPRLAHDGKPVAVQLIGVVPVARKV